MKQYAKLALFGALFMAGSAYAIPTLQLNILGGTYDSGTETTVSNDPTLTLQAYLTPGNGANVDLNALLSDTYYIAFALVPQTGPAASSLGTFDVNSTTVNVTADMTYGTPPLETTATQLSDPGDLPTHSIYDTFYYQLAFQFDPNAQVTPFDVQLNAGMTPSPGTGMYVVSFSLDVSNLDWSVLGGLHYDLYNSSIVDCGRNPNCVVGDVDVDDFAPPSHDAESRPPHKVPEPGTLALLGSGLLGLGLVRRRRR